MALSKLVFWYQKKIGTYDKQQWERTVEQKIFKGLNQVPMRTAKLKTDLIDVDLVRGSLFPKTKAKHGIARVAYHALKRIIFLPLYAQWWIRQTNIHTYVFFILLYHLQLLNMYIYYSYLSKEAESEIISCSEVLIPALMMVTLCIVHSQIVATNPGPQLSSSKKIHEKQTRRPRFRSRFRSRGERDCNSLSDKPSREEEKEIRNITNLATTFVKSSWKQSQDLEYESDTTCKMENMGNTLPKINGFTTSESIPKIINSEAVNNVNAKKTEENAIQQDDDGFESLNGNCSSDNDKGISNLKSEESSPDTKENKTNLTNRVNGFKLRNLYEVNVGVLNNFDQGSFREVKKVCDSEEEGECDDILSKPLSDASNSALEWIGATTNSDECSYSSEVEESDIQSETNEVMDLFAWECDVPSSILLCSNPASSDRVTCTIWENHEIKKAELSVLDISSAIISRVEAMPENVDNIYAGLFFAIFLSLLPSLRRVSSHFSTDSFSNNISLLVVDDLHKTANSESYAYALSKLINASFGANLMERTVILTSAFERLVLASLIICLLVVAERTFKQRFLYAKLFSHLTSSRRARKSDLPHFRLNKVRNIKTWLSVRSYLKRRGPQRSVDVIVSSVFILTLALLSFVSSELLKDIENLHSSYNIEALLWCFCLGMFILRFMTLGTKINKKYRNLSVLTTEQINLYLQIEQKPHKKEELMVANSVLKLAADLIKELESPFKISGLSANPYLYTITKVVLLSALSGVLSELLGFKLKLHKIKIK